MKKFTFVFILLFMFSGILLFNVKSEQFINFNGSKFGKVIEIIDGEAVLVQFSDNSTALVRLIGVITEGNSNALRYLNNVLLGEFVNVVTDSFLSNNQGRWNLAYLYKGNSLINSELILRGLGRANPNHANANLYTNFIDNETNAKYNELGIWRPENNIYGNYVGGNGININTATSSQLEEILYDVDRGLARSIVDYREKNPFNTAKDIKFVDGITYEIFDRNAHLMSVSTNINTATERELLTLKALTQTDVNRIMRHRSTTRFINTEQLYTGSLITRSDYELNKYYIDVVDKYEIDVRVPDVVVNINTASQSQLTDAGLSSSEANRIVNNRGSYSYKTLGELAKLNSSSLNISIINGLADNLTVATNINTASLREIISLFGSERDSDTIARNIYDNRPYRNISQIREYMSDAQYNKISKFIYTDVYNQKYININTASYEQLISAGFSSADANIIRTTTSEIKQNNDIPVEVKDLDYKISLYTNINTADASELESLGLSSNIVTAIISYRERQPFGSLSEVEEMMSNSGQGMIYRTIRDYIVLR